MGFDCYFFAGECEWPSSKSYVVKEAHFDHPQIQALNQDLFDDYQRSSATSGKIQRLRFFLKKHLYQFIEKFDLDLLIVENALAIPMNIPLGLAITELVAEIGIPTIAHHHDFAWERSRFKVSAASDYQFGAFPPVLPSVRHVVINSYGARQLALRTGASSTLIPNVMDFESPPAQLDKTAKGLRDDFGVAPDEVLLLQPTRIVPRKRIELAIELARRLEMDSTLVITHASGDEGDEYEGFLRNHAELMGVRVVFAAERFGLERGVNARGDQIYSLADIYQACDLVTYPSTVEGFGNAFLETLYYKKPIVISTYEIFLIDIKPKGFHVIDFGNFITQDTIVRARTVLENQVMCQEMVNQNYELGRKYYSYRVLEMRLRVLIEDCLGVSIESR
jgi:glycosyltransferase involved in cell wall biosynthesis